MATARWKKWLDVDALAKQMETYCANGLQPWTTNKFPYTTVAAVVARSMYWKCGGESRC
ncbi:hypothetical protein COLO4_31074 [Corchorus olitorius]|uniref:TOD1/MUCI70 glycosyltransferase-like domain-containing protein n=1 Tax=Corchorus olitorius TaxID=93759 RepID=A0A1R3H5Y1_9ROSI|nr:hypothetical protein COLO4_31074 [Corchorus olitorius]